MKFSDIDSRLQLADKYDDGQLIHHIHRLVECFVHSDGYLQTPADTVDKTVAGNALVAATMAERRIGELTDRILELEKLAITDELTCLLNRRGFAVELKRTLSSARRYDERGVLIYIDLDAFKQVNDRYGHAAGDEVLRHVGQLLRNSIRNTDYIGRLGGDEFAVLMPRTTWQSGLARAGTIERRLNTAAASWQAQKITIQASLGMQGYVPDDDPCELMNRADEAMYKTKKFRTKLDGGKINGTNVGNNPAGQPSQQLRYAAT